MSDKKQNKRNKNYDDDYNPRFRKQRKKVCLSTIQDLENKEKKYVYYVVIKTLY